MQSSVIYNSLCGVRINMKEGPLMASGGKTMNRIRDNNKPKNHVVNISVITMMSIIQK